MNRFLSSLSFISLLVLVGCAKSHDPAPSINSGSSKSPSQSIETPALPSTQTSPEVNHSPAPTSGSPSEAVPTAPIGKVDQAPPSPAKSTPSSPKSVLEGLVRVGNFAFGQNAGHPVTFDLEKKQITTIGDGLDHYTFDNLSPNALSPIKKVNSNWFEADSDSNFNQAFVGQYSSAGFLFVAETASKTSAMLLGANGSVTQTFPAGPALSTPYIDPATAKIIWVGKAGVTENGKTTKMPLNNFDPLLSSFLMEFSYDPSNRIGVMVAPDCENTGADWCLNGRRNTRALVWDIAKKKAYGPFDVGDGQEGSSAGVAIPNQKQFLIASYSHGCPTVQTVSYSGKQLDLPGTTAGLKSACEPDSYTPWAYDYRVSLGTIGGLVAVVFNSHLFVIDPKADRIVARASLNSAGDKPLIDFEKISMPILMVDEINGYLGVSYSASHGPDWNAEPVLEVFKLLDPQKP